MSIKDCNLIGFQVSQIWTDLGRSNETEDVSGIYSLAHSIFEAWQRAPKEWIWLPPIRWALTLISYSMVHSYELWEQSLSKEQMQEVWLTFLNYCKGAKTRQIHIDQAVSELEQLESAEYGRQECIQITPMEQLFHRHPWREALESDPARITSLLKVSTMGLLELGDGLFEELYMTVERREREEMLLKYDQFLAKFRELLPTAGERGEQELQLGLALSHYQAAEGVQPVGGPRRLVEMRALRNFKNFLESSSLDTDFKQLQAAIDRMDALALPDGGFEWIDAEKVQSLRAQAVKLQHAIKLRHLHPGQDSSVVDEEPKPKNQTQQVGVSNSTGSPADAILSAHLSNPPGGSNSTGSPADATPTVSLPVETPKAPKPKAPQKIPKESTKLTGKDIYNWLGFTAQSSARNSYLSMKLLIGVSVGVFLSTI